MAGKKLKITSKTHCYHVFPITQVNRGQVESHAEGGEAPRVSAAAIIVTISTTCEDA